MSGTSEILFWVVAALIGIGVAYVLVRPLLGRGTDSRGTESADLQVYKDQLSEVDRDIARGTLDAAEGEALKTEISRRLLAAADVAETMNDTQSARSPVAAVVAGLVVLAGGAVTYALIGTPGMPDQPREQRVAENRAAWETRPTQAQMRARLADLGADLDPLAALPEEQRALLAQLRDVLAERPDDLRGFELLRNFLADAEDWSGAAEAQARIIDIKGAEATAGDHLALAENLIFATGGYISPEAEDVLREVLVRDPENGAGRYFSGLAAAQAGRPDIAYDIWSRLLAEGPETAPWIAAIRGQIADIALAAGREVPELRGPSQDDLAAAQGMSEADRTEMIRGMVGGLAERLATEGGPSEDWARLIRSLGVLGERARANEILQEALSVFADSPTDIAIIRQAGRDAEILQ